MPGLWAASGQGQDDLRSRVGEALVKAEQVAAAALASQRTASQDAAAKLEEAVAGAELDLPAIVWAVSDALR